ncbi:ABC transporter G family member 14-like [Glycine max]|uniref:ABC transporter G family member 14-like n=1 Tax=Glycine max TaxID=3847 RepID=UPI001B3564DE|nr:ABC transporter G family member 14-like [Glycine max]
MTIYQPSSKLFYMFQKILLLSDGRSLYFGKGENVMNYFSSIGYAPSVATDPTDFLLDLANGFPWWQSGADQMHDRLVLPTLFVTITCWMGGLKVNASIFFQTLAVALLYALVSQGFGLAIGALLINNQKVAVLLLGSQFNDYDSYHCGPNVTSLVLNYPTIKHVGIEKQGFSVAVLVAMLVGYGLIAYFALMIGTKFK